MNNPPAQTLDNEKLTLIPARFDDVKKLWKTLRTSLTESLTTFSLFGKSLFKASRNLHFSFHHADPSYICKLTLNLLTRQARASQLLSDTIDEAFKILSKDIESYEEKLELTRNQTTDLFAENIRNLGLARATYARERANYEKVCKEAEQTVAEKKKPISDPLVYYNRTHQRRLKRKVDEALRNLQIAEQQTQEACEQLNVRQEMLNVVIGESMKTLKKTISTVFENMLDNIKKHTKALLDVLQKELIDFETSSTQASVDDFVPPTGNDEQMYLEHRKQPQMEIVQSQEQGNKEGSNLKDEKNKARFTEIHTKLLTGSADLTDLEVQEYIEVSQKHFEVSMIVLEDRQRVLKGLKGYMQDLSALCLSVEKVFQKLSKGNLTQTSSTSLCKKIGSTADPLFESLGSFGAIFQQFAMFINMKAPLLDNVINDQKDGLKAFQISFPKAFKEYTTVKTFLVTLGMQQDKQIRKILEATERDPLDERIPVMKAELENLKKTREENLLELRKHAIEAAKVVAKSFEDYRNYENARFSDFTHVIKGLLAQEYLFFKGLVETSVNLEASVNISEGRGLEAGKVMGQDESLAVLAQVLNINIEGETDSGDQQDDTSLNRKNSAIVFQKLYSPPEDVLGDSDGEKSGDGDEDEEGEDADEKLQRRFALRSGEKELDNFTCAVEMKIIRQGRMYIYPTAICFSTVKILGDIAIKIPISDIQKIEKKTNAFVFDNSLALLTKHGEIKFISFFSRDKAYNLIVSLMKEQYLQKEASMTPEKLLPPADKILPSPENLRKTSKADSVNSEEGIKKKTKEDVILERLSIKQNDSEDNKQLRRASLVLSDDGDNKIVEKVVEAVGSPVKAHSLTRLDDKDDKDSQITSSEEKKKFSTGQFVKAHINSPLALAYPIKKSEKSGGDFNIAVSVVEQGQATDSDKKEQDEAKPAEKVDNSPEKSTSESQDENSPAIDLKAKEEEAAKQAKMIEEEIARRMKEAEESRRLAKEQEEAKERKKLLAELEKRKKAMQGTYREEEKYPTTVIDEVFSCSVIDIYNALFSERQVQYKGKSFNSPWLVLKSLCGDTDIKNVVWASKAPYEGFHTKDNLEVLKSIVNGPQKSERKLNFIHPVRGGGPFVPKSCPIEEKHYGFWLGADEFIMQSEIFTSKIPMSDCFIVKNSFKAKEIGDGKCQFMWRFQVDFVKSTMFQGKISKGSLEENTEFGLKILLPFLKENLVTYLQEKSQELKKLDTKKKSQAEAERKKLLETITSQVKLEKQVQPNQAESGVKQPELEIAMVKKDEVASQENSEKDGKEEVSKAEEAGEAELKDQAIAEELKSTDDDKSIAESIKEEDSLRKRDIGDLMGSRVSVRQGFEEDFMKFMKEAEKDRQEMRGEMMAMRKLLTVIIALNCLLFLFLLFKSF